VTQNIVAAQKVNNLILLLELGFIEFFFTNFTYFRLSFIKNGPSQGGITLTSVMEEMPFTIRNFPRQVRRL